MYLLNLLEKNKEIQGLLNSNPGYALQFAHRQTNMVAHRLASHSFELNVNLEWLYSAPKLIVDALMYDCNCIKKNYIFVKTKN